MVLGVDGDDPGWCCSGREYYDADDGVHADNGCHYYGDDGGDGNSGCRDGGSSVVVTGVMVVARSVWYTYLP